MTENRVISGERIEMLGCRSESLGEFCITYSLYGITLRSLRTYYVIGAENDTEGALGVLGEEKEAAEGLFDRLSTLLVTPCTLEDVLSDIRTENRC